MKHSRSLYGIIFTLLLLCANAMFSQTKTTTETMPVGTGQASVTLKAIRSKSYLEVRAYNTHPSKTFKVSFAVTVTLRGDKGEYDREIETTVTLEPNGEGYGMDGGSHYASAGTADTFATLTGAVLNNFEWEEVSDSNAKADNSNSGIATQTPVQSSSETRYNTNPQIKAEAERQNRLRELQNAQVNAQQVQQQANYDKAVAAETERRESMQQTEETVTAVTGVITDYIKQRAEEREARWQAEEEEEERQRQLRAEEESRQLAVTTMINNRKAAIAEFPAKDVPLGSKDKADRLFFFFYAYNATINNENGAVLYLSNVFEIGRYNDGTRAYTSTIKSEIANLTPFEETLHGYYYTYEEAENLRQTLASILQSNGVTLHQVSYKGKPNTKQAAAKTPAKPTADKGEKSISLDGNNFAPATINTAKPGELPREEKKKQDKGEKTIKLD